MEIDTTKDKPWKENFSLFLKEPTRRNLRQLLQLGAVEDYDLMKQKMLFGDMERKTSPNPEYPQESYEGFIKRIIEIKKDVIIKLVSK